MGLFSWNRNRVARKNLDKQVNRAYSDKLVLNQNIINYVDMNMGKVNSYKDRLPNSVGYYEKIYLALKIADSCKDLKFSQIDIFYGEGGESSSSEDKYIHTNKYNNQSLNKNFSKKENNIHSYFNNDSAYNQKKYESFNKRLNRNPVYVSSLNPGVCRVSGTIYEFLGINPNSITPLFLFLNKGSSDLAQKIAKKINRRVITIGTNDEVVIKHRMSYKNRSNSLKRAYDVRSVSPYIESKLNPSQNILASSVKKVGSLCRDFTYTTNL